MYLLKSAVPVRGKVFQLAASFQRFSVEAKFLAILLLSLGGGGCERSDESTRGTQVTVASTPRGGRVVDLAAVDFSQLKSEKASLLLDVRTPGEVRRGRLAGASVVDLRDAQFERKVAAMQKDKAIFVYCASGGRSAQAAQILLKLGFQEVYNLSGGIGAWRRAGLAIEAGNVPRSSPSSGAMSPASFDKLLASEPVLLVDFQTKWCAPCQKMAPIVEKMSQDREDSARVISLDIDESVSLAQRENISGVPVFVLYEKGRETWRHSGVTTLAQLEKKLKVALSP